MKVQGRFMQALIIEIHQAIYSQKLALLCWILFRSVLSFTYKNFFISYFLIFSILLQHHISNLSKYLAPILLVSRSLSHIKLCSKHNT